MLKFYLLIIIGISLSLEGLAFTHYNVIDKTVYYTMDKKFSQREKDYIKTSIKKITDRSCLVFKIHNIHYEHIPNWIEFVRPDVTESCYTKVRSANATSISLSPHCFQDSWVVHEVLHALGFDHEHQRRDRNCYVEVHSSKLDSPDYAILKEMDITSPYDVHSVMHYGRGTFMRPAKDYPDQNVQFRGKDLMSQRDVWTLNHEFCGEPHFCENNQRQCEEEAESIRSKGCVIDP